MKQMEAVALFYRLGSTVTEQMLVGQTTQGWRFRDDNHRSLAMAKTH